MQYRIRNVIPTLCTWWRCYILTLRITISTVLIVLFEQSLVTDININRVAILLVPTTFVSGSFFLDSSETFTNVDYACFLPQLHVTFPPAGSYAVDGLKPDTLYMFSLAARSEMGLGVYTQLIEARTAQSSKYCTSTPRPKPIAFYLPLPGAN